MSNSIWHKRDKTPKDFCDVVLANFTTGSCCVFLSPFHNVSFDYDRWAYLTDIIAQADKAERLQKAVDLIANMEQRLCIDDPVDILDDVLKIAKDEIKQLIKGTTVDTNKGQN